MNRIRYIRVPKSQQAMEDYDLGRQTSEQIEEVALTEPEYNYLNDLKLFDMINHKCGLMIDDYEEEVLESTKIGLAIMIIDDLLVKNKSILLSDLKGLFEYAKEYKTLVGFDF